jgi:hypothetical protein
MFSGRTATSLCSQTSYPFVWVSGTTTARTTKDWPAALGTVEPILQPSATIYLTVSNCSFIFFVIHWPGSARHDRRDAGMANVFILRATHYFNFHGLASRYIKAHESIAKPLPRLNLFDGCSYQQCT